MTLTIENSGFVLGGGGSGGRGDVQVSLKEQGQAFLVVVVVQGLGVEDLKMLHLDFLIQVALTMELESVAPVMGRKKHLQVSLMLVSLKKERMARV